MLRILILGFQAAAFIVIILLASQIPVSKDAKGRVKRVSQYVEEFTSLDFIQAPIRWAGRKCDFIEGHGYHLLTKKLRQLKESRSADAIMERAELSGLLKHAPASSNPRSGDDHEVDVE